MTRPPIHLAQLATLTVCLGLCMLSLTGASALAAGNADVGPCPNESFVGFEPFLADCGAYERVSPPFKAGTRLSSIVIASNGSRVIGFSIGVFGGAEGYGAPEEVVYETTRTPMGWQTSAISPPQSVFPAQRFDDFNPDLDRGVWLMHTPTQSLNAEDLYIREPSGTFVKVGPEVPPYATKGPAGGTTPILNEQAVTFYVGASNDLSHIFFGILGDGPLWPGDTTTGTSTTSVYEYAGTGNEVPMLVGVDNQGRLISDCGITLGGYPQHGQFSRHAPNAISFDGETVFFTPIPAAECGSSHGPLVKEVYARVGVGPAARTIAISEPSAEDCAECQTNEPMAAEYEGAAQDGKRVFFLTEQELFKGDKGMNLYEYDFNNPAGQKLLRLAASSAEPHVFGVSAVSGDGSRVYFTAEAALTGANRENQAPSTAPGAQNLYLSERDAAHPAGGLTFIGTGAIGTSQVTPDGRFLAFNATGGLAGNTSGASQVFEYDAVREELVRVSVGERGYPAGNESADAQGSFIVGREIPGVVMAAEEHRAIGISDDGSVVYFEGGGGLTRTAAGTTRRGTYEYRSSGVLSDGEVFSVSNGDPEFNGLINGIDRTGTDAFFQTASAVLASDRDTMSDLYDARVGGGFPAASPMDCELSLSCQGPVSGAPVLSGVASVLAPAGGNWPGASVPPASGPASPGGSGSQRLAKALRKCRGSYRPGKRRRSCETAARRRHARVKSTSKG